MRRLLYIVVLAALEASLAGAVLDGLTWAGPGWPAIFGLICLGALADQLGRRLPERAERPALAAGASLAVLALLGLRMGGPLAGLAALLPGSPRFAPAYFYALLALLLFWRGTRLDGRDGGAVAALFGRGAALIGAALLLGGLLGTGAGSPGAGGLAGQVLGYICAGLLALAIAQAQEVDNGRLGAIGWRWLLTLGLAIGLVAGLGLLGAGLLGGGEMLAVAQGALRLLLIPLALVGGLIAWLILTFLAEPLSALIAAILARLRGLPPIVEPTPEVGTETPTNDAFAAIERLAEGATFLMALIPVVILVALILLLRRGVRGRRPEEEERESLGVLQSLRADLGDLLGRLRGPLGRRAVGLRAALAALRGADPATRARRAYVGLLLLLEGRARPRPPERTPAEFAPMAAELAPPEAVATLTRAYEQARYSPAGPSAAEAAAAEQALEEARRG